MKISVTAWFELWGSIRGGEFCDLMTSSVNPSLLTRGLLYEVGYKFCASFMKSQGMRTFLEVEVTSKLIPF
jgi:hypothetical protein